jgi:serine O-acetyltransferase
MIKNIEMRSQISQIYHRNGFHAQLLILLLYFEKKFTVKLPFKILRKIIIQGVYCSQIHPDSFIDVEAICTLRLPHPYMIIIHRSTKIGHNCTIFHECTIGVIEEKGLEAAILGNNVYVGCKSLILGAINIGDNVKIGAGATVLKDVNEKTTVTGVWK